MCFSARWRSGGLTSTSPSPSHHLSWRSSTMATGWKCLAVASSIPECSRKLASLTATAGLSASDSSAWQWCSFKSPTSASFGQRTSASLSSSRKERLPLSRSSPSTHRSSRILPCGSRRAIQRMTFTSLRVEFVGILWRKSTSLMNLQIQKRGRHHTAIGLRIVLWRELLPTRRLTSSSLICERKLRKNLRLSCDRQEMEILESAERNNLTAKASAVQSQLSHWVSPSTETDGT
mmetsp:Transcript_55790/g.105051  ORF Transcript_55790/g.105051 Transcript_55790/m.105051 type:complete len:234 (-) Transcript_55790:86-787(-)